MNSNFIKIKIIMMSLFNNLKKNNMKKTIMILNSIFWNNTNNKFIKIEIYNHN
jgi:hypothetical protein